jgi:serine/threonine protein kinase
MPTRIGRYRIVDRIGRGAMGVVYSAHDEVIDRPVALKVLMADLESDPDTRARFYREAQAGARLLHPNVITVFDAGEDQGRSFIAMQLLEGAPLPAYLKRPAGAGLDRKIDLMIQVCEGLAAAHGQGIIHRDLKPNNLYVQSDGLLKILDFGVARLANSSMTVAGTMLGTPDYMSPEQARGAQVDARSDIFSAGAVFYYMLAGKKPFPGPDLPTVLRQLQFEEPAPLRDVVPELALVVQQAMAKSPDDRPSRVEDLLAALVRFRRQHQAETRKLVLQARQQVDDMEALVASAREAAAVLGVAPDDDSTNSLRDLQLRFPLLAKRGPRSDAVTPDRDVVTRMVAELTTYHQQKSAATEAMTAHIARLEAGKRALASFDARTALRLFETVAAAYPSSPRARELAESCRPLAAEQEARDEQIAASMTAARRALQGQEWTNARDECRRALALVPSHELAAALLREAEQGIERERQRLESMVQRLVERAAQAIERQEFSEADAALKEAEAVQSGAPSVNRLRHQLADARAAAEAAELLRQQTVDEIRRARGAFRRGRYDEAVQQLRGFLQAEPKAYEAELELKRLISLRDSIASAAAASRRQAAELTNRASVLAESGALREARAVARAALQTDPTDVSAATLIDRLLARELEERIAAEHARTGDERTTEAEPILAAGRGALARGYIAIALKAGLVAQRLAPDRSDVKALVDEARAAMASEDREPFELGATPLAMTVSPRSGDTGGVLDWATHLFRGGQRRGKA